MTGTSFKKSTTFSNSCTTFQIVLSLFQKVALLFQVLVNLYHFDKTGTSCMIFALSDAAHGHGPHAHGTFALGVDESFFISCKPCTDTFSTRELQF